MSAKLDIKQYQTGISDIPKCPTCQAEMTFLSNFGKFYFACSPCISSAIQEMPSEKITTNPKLHLAEQLAKFKHISLKDALAQIDRMI